MLSFEQLKAKYPLPFELKATQVEDVANGQQFPHVLLDLPVGYGKTAVSTYIALSKEPDRILVVMLPILTKDWERWINSIPNAGKALQYKGSPAMRAKLNLEDCRWVFVSYGLYRNDYQRLKAWLDGVDGPTQLMVDEAQNLKNSASVLFKNVKDMSGNAEVCLITGTPMSKPEDAYAYVKLKTPTIYRNKNHFDRVHIAETDFFGAPVRYQHLDLLNSNLRLACVHRDKADVQSHLQSRTWPMHYDLHPQHMALYRKLMEEQLLILPDDGKVDATTAQKLYTISQQIVTNWGEFSGNPADQSTTFELIDAVCDTVGVDNYSNSKLIIWTWYKLTTRSILKHLADRGAVAAYSESDSQKAVDSFMNDKHTRILVAQPGSAGAGLNPQYVCSEALFIQTPTRTIQFVQAAGRIDREGQKFQANNRIAVASGTIQEMLYNNLLSNDDEITKVSKSRTSIRDAIYGAK